MSFQRKTWDIRKLESFKKIYDILGIHETRQIKGKF